MKISWNLLFAIWLISSCFKKESRKMKDKIPEDCGWFISGCPWRHSGSKSWMQHCRLTKELSMFSENQYSRVNRQLWHCSGIVQVVEVASQSKSWFSNYFGGTEFTFFKVLDTDLVLNFCGLLVEKSYNTKGLRTDWYFWNWVSAYWFVDKSKLFYYFHQPSILCQNCSSMTRKISFVNDFAHFHSKTATIRGLKPGRFVSNGT